jgi:hypothetical protein
LLKTMIQHPTLTKNIRTKVTISLLYDSEVCRGNHIGESKCHR